MKLETNSWKTVIPQETCGRWSHDQQRRQACEENHAENQVQMGFLKLPLQIKVSKESTTRDRDHDRRFTCDVTRDNDGIPHEISLERCSKRKRSNHYQVDQRSYGIHIFFSEEKRILKDTFT